MAEPLIQGGIVQSEWSRHRLRRLALGRRVREIMVELGQGGSARRQALLEERSRVENELADIKTWFGTHGHQDPYVLNKLRQGRVDEFDLKNVLSEPQTLLQQAYAALLRLTKRAGITETDRGILDALQDYLRRNGMAL